MREVLPSDVSQAAAVRPFSEFRVIEDSVDSLDPALSYSVEAWELTSVAAFNRRPGSTSHVRSMRTMDAQGGVGPRLAQ